MRNYKYVPHVGNERKMLDFCELHFLNALLSYESGRLTGFDTYSLVTLHTPQLLDLLINILFAYENQGLIPYNLNKRV